MKTILVTITIVLSSLILKAQNADSAITNDDTSETTTITVNVPVKSSEGSVIFGLFTEQNFMNSAPVQGLESEIVDGKATVTFENVTPGTYAITLFHDKNGNKQMDFEPNGMPIEMYGVSNNVMSMGPPMWSDAKFEVNGEPLTLEIIM
jgi:uncharacterized protein (DUF2141 family)